jgi:hypothetical protein
MALGIVSVSAVELGQRVLSLVAAGAACAVYATVAPAWADVWRRRRASPESFAAVAATAVLGTRAALTGLHVLPDVVLALTAVGWLAMWVGLRSTRDLGTASGTRLLLVVSTQSLVVLASFAARQLAPVAVIVFTFGLVLYPLVVAHIPLAELRDSEGDVWILMGALAISTLAAARMSLLVAHAPMRVVAVVLWACATAAFPVLVAAELRWPRTRFHVKRWSTVFPLAMYAAATVAVAHATGVRELGAARVAFWAAVAVAALSAAGAVRHRPSTAAAGRTGCSAAPRVRAPATRGARQGAAPCRSRPRHPRR